MFKVVTTAAIAAGWTDVPLAVLAMGLVISGLVAMMIVAGPHTPATSSRTNHAG